MVKARGLQQKRIREARRAAKRHTKAQRREARAERKRARQAEKAERADGAPAQRIQNKEEKKRIREAERGEKATTKAQQLEERQEKKRARREKKVARAADAERRSSCTIQEFPVHACEIWVDGNNCMFVGDFGQRGRSMLKQRTAALYEALNSWATAKPDYKVVLVFDHAHQVEKDLEARTAANLSVRIAHGTSADQLIMGEFDARFAKGEQVPLLVTADRQMIDVQVAFNGQVLKPRVLTETIGLARQHQDGAMVSTGAASSSGAK